MEQESFTTPQLEKDYGVHFDEVLLEYLKPLPREPRKQVRYLVRKPLPTRLDYCRMRDEFFLVGLGRLFDAAFDLLKEVKNHITRWLKAVCPTKRNSKKNQELDTVRQLLEDQRAPFMPIELREFSTVYLPNRSLPVEGNFEESTLREVLDMFSWVLKETHRLITLALVETTKVIIDFIEDLELVIEEISPCRVSPCGE